MQRSPFRRWIDKDDEIEQCWRSLDAGDYRGVYIATPPHVTGTLLERLSQSRARLVFAEKPWFSDLDQAKRVIPILRRSNSVFRFVDHYLHRPAMRWLLEQQNLRMLLGGTPLEFEGRLLEATGPASPAMGIGVLNDTLIHLVTIVRRIWPAANVEILGVHARQSPEVSLQTETFVQVRAIVNDERPIKLTLTAAKAHPIQEAAKAVVIRGPAATLNVDLDHETVHLLSIGGARKLYSQGDDEDAYLYLLRRLEAEDRTIGLDAHEALAVLHILSAIRSSFRPPP